MREEAFLNELLSMEQSIFTSLDMSTGGLSLIQPLTCQSQELKVQK